MLCTINGVKKFIYSVWLAWQYTEEAILIGVGDSNAIVLKLLCTNEAASLCFLIPLGMKRNLLASSCVKILIKAEIT
jgi:hypothetical protein